MLDFLKYGLLVLTIYYVVLYIIYGEDVFYLKKKPEIIIEDIQVDPVEEPEKEEEKNKKNPPFIKIINKKGNNIKNITTLAENNAESGGAAPELDVKDIEIEISEEPELEDNAELQKGIEIENLVGIINNQANIVEEEQQKQDYEDEVDEFYKKNDIERPM